MPINLEQPSWRVERYILCEDAGYPIKITGSYSIDCEDFYWYDFILKSEDVFKTLKEACEVRTKILDGRQRQALEAFKVAYNKYEESLKGLEELS